jgi:hypothetical protein
MLEDWDMEEAKVMHNFKPIVPTMNIDINLNEVDLDGIS